jgi:DNA helicase-2/ATP-dependent DNA helicase PcrA
MTDQSTKLLQSFNAAYQNLNEEQRKAVDTIEGPVMVIAGPGTGKTQILACRIGKILLETDAAPENILCLTYTDAGGVAMRKRLVQFIGPEAYKVNIFTFHSFCNEVIQQNLHLFEKNILDPISELETIQLFKELIDTLPKNNPLKRYRGDVYYEAKPMRDLFSTMKKEGWSAAYVLESINNYIESLNDKEEFKYQKKYGDKQKGDWKAIYYDTLDRMEKLGAAVKEFDRFNQKMRDWNRYDFDDMINWVIKAFSEIPNLLASYQEKYQYILVDEYQDTSGTQNKIVELLINYWDQPNIFVVGDDDQSIFRFQGANVENMLQISNLYKKDLLTVVLTRNYRSTQPILDMSKTLIEHNKDRLVNQIDGLTKELIASNPAKTSVQFEPQLIEYLNPRQEMIGIVKQVEQLLNQGVQPGRIGIIFKENKYGEGISRFFNLLQIPVYSKRHINAFELPLVQKLIHVLRYLATEHYIPFSGDEILFKILHYDWFNIEPIEIAKLSIEVSERRFKSQKISMRQLLMEKTSASNGSLFPISNNVALKSASEAIEKLIAAVPNHTLQTLLELIIMEARVVNCLLNKADKHWQLQVLTAFFDFVKEETHRKPTMQLADLVALIDLMEKEGIALPIVQTSGTEKGVNLMTAHGSKGLEFEYVFVAGINAKLWEQKQVSNKNYKMPDTLFSSSTSNKDDQEIRRLFYVALTRAETHLYLSYHKLNGEAKEMERSVFIEEIRTKHELVEIKKTIEPEDLNRFAVLHLGEGAKPELEQLEDALIAPILDKFVMNVTALNSYLACPVSFYYNNFIRVPSAKNEAMEFGSAIHGSLQFLFQYMKEDEPNHNFPSKEQLFENFDLYMKRNRELFTQEQFARRLEYGHEVLSNYYNDKLYQKNHIILLEHNVKNVVIRNVPLKGKLDKIEFNGNSVRVVDYKTGNPENAKSKFYPPNDKYPNGGDYWRQAVFYKILMDNYPGKNYRTDEVVFDFVEPDNKKKYTMHSVKIGDSDIATVSQQIEETWNNIQNRNFYVGCGEEKCHWCNFVKTNELAKELHEPEMLED